MNFQSFPSTLDLMLGILSSVCILLSVSVCITLCCFFRSIPYIKKNLLTFLDELLVVNFTIFVCVQCSVCLFSLICSARNQYVYLAFYIILYGSAVLGLGIGIVLSFARVFILLWVSVDESQ